MEEGKKGVVTAVSIALMLVALLYLVSSIANYSRMVGQANSGLAQITGAEEQFDAAAQGARVLSKTYGTRVSMAGNRVNFTQDLSSVGYYRQGMEGWGRFLSQHGGANLSTEGLPPVYVDPQNFSVRHNGTNLVSFEPGNFTVNEYNVTVLAFGVPGLDDSELNQTWSPPCLPDALLLDVVVSGFGAPVVLPPTCVNASVENVVIVYSSGSRAAVIRVSNRSLYFEYVPLAPGGNVYLTVAAELNSTPSDAELGRFIVHAGSGAVQKDGRVLLG